jgi:uncharacterized protein YjbJ (UPF0337 family)
MQGKNEQNISKLFWTSYGGDRTRGQASKSAKLWARNGSAIKLLDSARRSTNAMKQSTKDQVAGKAHEIKGAVKEKIGHATNKPTMEHEGQDEKAGGKMTKKVGEVEKVLGT